MSLVLFVAALAAILWLAPRVSRLDYGGLTLDTIASGLDTPWSIAFLPDGRILVTERVGRLRIVRKAGDISPPLAGLPTIAVAGEGGLLGVIADPGFSHNHQVYWSFAEPQPGSAKVGLALARARLEGESLSDVRIVFRDPDAVVGTTSFGGRMIFLQDRTLLLTLGDRGYRDDAQRLISVRGKIIRIDTDGRAPEDNPFMHSPGANPAVWALGFRDPQGITVNAADGVVWASDHGPYGGDEINRIVAGHNYGWPVVTYGVAEDSGARIGEGTDKPGMDPAAIWWVPPGTAPTQLAIVRSTRYPGWLGQMLVGTLWGQSLVRITMAGDKAAEQERLHFGPYQRVRDICTGPDGWLYVVTNVPDGRIVRLKTRL